MRRSLACFSRRTKRQIVGKTNGFRPLPCGRPGHPRNSRRHSAATGPAGLASGDTTWSNRRPRWPELSVRAALCHASPWGPADVPTLFRFLAVVAILAGLAFAAMFALATFVEPTPREISVTIPNAKLQPK